jgi:flagellar protein FlbD
VISLTRFSGQRFALNPDLIERVEATPDTVITLVDGSRQVVREGLDEVVDKVQRFRASVVALSQQMEVVPHVPAPGADDDAGPTLRLVDGSGGDA